MNIWTKEVQPAIAWSLITLTAIICAWFVYQAALGYYADKIAMYNAQGELAWQIRNQAIKARGQIGTGAFIKK